MERDVFVVSGTGISQEEGLVRGRFVYSRHREFNAKLAGA